MRIRFKQNVDVDLSAVPKSAYGAIGIRHPARVPRLKAAGEKREPQFQMEPVTKSHFFRQGWHAELPDEMAQVYIDAEQAEIATNQVHTTERAAEVRDEALAEIYKLPSYMEALNGEVQE